LRLACALLVAAVLPHAQACLAQTESLPEIFDEAASLDREASDLTRKERYAEAVAPLERFVVLETQLRGEHDVQVLNGLRRLSYVYYKLARYKDSLAVDERRLKLSTEALGEKHPDTIGCLRDVAIAYENAYEDGYARALPLLEKALRLRIEVLGEQHRDTASLMTDVANAYLFLGRYSDALALYERELRIAVAAYGPDDERTQNALLVVAIAYQRLGREDEAAPIFEKNLQRVIARKNERSRDGVFALVQLAASYNRLGRPAEALPLLERAFKLRQELFPENDRESIHFLEIIADTYIRLGRPESAAPLYAQAAELNAKDAGERSFVTLDSLGNLARTYVILGRFDEARALDERILRLRTEVQGAGHPDTVVSLVDLADVDRRLGRGAEALALYEKVVPAVEALRANADLSPENRQALFSRWVGAYKAYAAMLVAAGRDAEAFQLAELSKARTLLESTAMRRANQAAFLTEDEHNRVRAYEGRIAALDDGIVAAESAGRKLALEADKNRVLADFAALRRELAAKYPKYAQLNDVKILDAVQGRSILPDGAMLVSYLIDGNRPMVFTLSSRGLNASLLDAIPNLPSTVEAYRRLISNPLGAAGIAAEGETAWKLPDGSYGVSRHAPQPGALQVKDVEEIGRYLGERLLAPIAARLSGVTRLIVSPDGALAMLPFETLPVGGRPLVAGRDVSYIQSLSMLALLKAREEDYRALGARKDLFAMGGAIYQAAGASGLARGAVGGDIEARPAADIRLMLARGEGDPLGVQRVFDALGIEWPNLPGTEKEVGDVVRVFGIERSAAFTGRDATEAKLLQLNGASSLADFRYLLFSAHGYLSMEEPALSSLVLGQVDKAPGTDGYVTAGEWPSYDLKSDLVVLSACDTGLGKLVQGEGVMGLPYALYVAGNRNTLLSLWPVVDESTAEFMRGFFSRLKSGASQSEALNQTKREFMAGARFGRPAFWAPFVLYGY
jgi:CHAT domain-containing protein